MAPLRLHASGRGTTKNAATKAALSELDKLVKQKGYVKIGPGTVRTNHNGLEFVAAASCAVTKNASK